MSTLERDLLRLIEKLSRERTLREKRLARKLLEIYEECRQTLLLKFLEARGGQDTLKLQYLEGTIQDIERQMKFYTNLTAEARQRAIDEAFLLGQTVGAQMLAAGGINISVVAGIGQVNRGMIEALVGNIPKLAGRVEDHILFRIRDELTRGAVMGESIPKIARRILGTGLTQEGLKKPFPSIQKRCEVIARTEIIKASDVGYEDLAVKAQEAIGEEIYDAWLTAGDSRVEAECRAIANGTDPRFKSIPGYPGVYRRDSGPRPVIHTHPRCRCRRIPFLKSWAESGALNLAELRGREGKNTKLGIGGSTPEQYNNANRRNPVRSQALQRALDEREREIANRETEKGYLFDPQGNIILSKVGDRSSIRFTDEELVKFADNILTHN
ncbi:MAG: phage head morphogenesis protein, partial [Peptococcaceae bacterium]|nr:phage head morphogenesis protein [Peptococcaceae bacterium]